MFANYEKKIIEMTKSESKAAGMINTAEYSTLKELRTQNPTFRIVIKATKSRDNMKGLTVSYMKKYIEKHDDNEKTHMTVFNSLRGLDADGKEVELARRATYGELKMWFLDTFPEVEQINQNVNDILKQAKRSREEKRQAAKEVA